MSWYLLFAMFGLISCVVEDEVECVTSFDCGDGYTCEAGFCMELPDDGTGIIDKDTILPEGSDSASEAEAQPDVSDVTDGADTVVDEDIVADDTADADDPTDEDTAVDTDSADDTVDAVDADMVDETVDVDNVVPVDECTTQTNPCDNNGDAAATCADTTDSYICTCSFGFDPTGGACMDLDECTLGTDNCHTNATCTNTPGLFTCACNVNYTGDGTTACDLCVTDGQCGATCAACGGGTLYCKDNGNGTTQCVACTLEEHCPGAHCLLSDNTCVACRDNNDCNTGVGEVCFTATHTCGVNTCGDGVLGGAIPAFVEGFEGGMPAYADGGDWGTSTSQKHGGSYAVVNDDVYDDGSATMAMIKYTDGQICFWYAGYSESFDYLYVYVDGSEKFSISGNHQTWTQQCITVTAGYRMLELTYTKDSSMSSGWDAYYIDDIQFYNATTEQCDGGSNTCGTLGFDCGSAVSCGPDCTWNAAGAGCHDDGGCGC